MTNPLVKFCLDSDDPCKALDLALWYEDQGHMAPAHTFFMKAAEKSNDNNLSYVALIRASFCYRAQGSRDTTEKVLLENALVLVPDRPEAYYFLSAFYHRKGEWQNSYLHAHLGLLRSSNHEELPYNVPYPGEHQLKFLKAVAGWWWGKGDESRELLLDIYQSCWNLLDNDCKKMIKESMEMVGLEVKQQVRGEKGVVDCFPFFNEAELLELRVNLLKDHVDGFIITEMNQTHSGKEKGFICKDLVESLGFSDKVKVIEVEIGNDLELDQVDIYNSSESDSRGEVLAWARERVQRDAILQVTGEYSDDTVFILGDCDEIINPEFIEYLSSVSRGLPQNILKIPLVMLEGRADRRLFEGQNPVPWQNSLLMCTSKQLKEGGTPTRMRSNVMNIYPPVWVTESGEILQDCGWHFTWMGDADRRLKKAESFIHYANLSSVNTLSSGSMEQVLSRIPGGAPIQERGISVKYERRHYPVELLPKEVLSIPKVRDFLLPKDNSLGIKEEVIKLYESFDSQYGVWGWCPTEKAHMIIDCVTEVCERESDPVCVEIGVYGGKSLIPFAVALRELGKGKVYGVDPWDNSEAVVGYDGPHEEFWGNVNLEAIRGICNHAITFAGVEYFVSLIRETSDNAKEIRNISVLHIDGQHTEQLSRDIKKFASNVVEGGYCFVDDVEWSEHTLKSIPLMEDLGFERVQSIFGCMLYRRVRKTSDSLFNAIATETRPTCWVVDNFYEKPDKVREFALKQDYLEGGIGRGFIGRRTHQQFLFQGLKEKFEGIMGRKITKWEEHGMNGRFQVAWSGEPLVYHCDSQQWGGMLYLTPGAPYQCGTTLYAHKQTRARSYYEPGWDAAWVDIPGDCHLDGTPFEPVDVLGNVYNRLIIFDASCIHAASQYFGTVKENARLWQMFFFDTADRGG